MIIILLTWVLYNYGQSHDQFYKGPKWITEIHVNFKFEDFVTNRGGGGTNNLFSQYLNVFRILDFTDDSVCIITDK